MNAEKWAPGKIEIKDKKISNLYPRSNSAKHTTPTITRHQSIANTVDTTNKPTDTKSAVYDSGATSNCGRIGDDFEPTNKKSNKVFHMPNGDTAAASAQAKLKLNIREPARTVDMVPDLKHNSLLSASKFADANYITVLTPTEVLIYNGNDLTLRINKDAILRGW